MIRALAINAGLVVAELAGGLITGSLALLADAGHVLSDAGAIGLALGAARLAARAGGDAARLSTFGPTNTGPRSARDAVRLNG